MKANINVTYRDQDGNEILNPVEGDRSYSPETKRLYQYTNGNWEMIEGDVGLNMTMYDINKQVISQLPSLDKEDIAAAKQTITEYFKDQRNSFYMLLCNDINYYTLFQVINDSSLPNAGSEAIECALEIGDIKVVDVNDDGAIEIWVKPEDTDAMLMYLFPYDRGVVQCTL